MHCLVCSILGQNLLGGVRLFSGVCAHSTASWAPDVLGHIWTKQRTIAVRLVLWSPSELFALIFKWDEKAQRQKEALVWLLAIWWGGVGDTQLSAAG